jgi:4-amino-4-deoxy-L-arabinose transferase-like glycosyltransferase
MIKQKPSSWISQGVNTAWLSTAKKLFPFFVMVMVWGLLYLPNLRTNPKWYGDETLIHDTARNLFKGIPSNFGLWNTFWHPHYPYQPLYTWICGLFDFISSGDIWGSRFFNVLLGLACAASIYGLGKRIFGNCAALFSSMMFLTYQQSIIHFRMSYAHNGAALGNLLLVLYLLQPANWRNDIRGGLGLALSAGSHPLFIHSALAACFTRIRNPKSWIPLFFPAGVYLLISMSLLYARFGPWLIEDLKHLFDSYSTRGEQDASGLVAALNNLMQFTLQDPYHLIMMIGLFLCFNKRCYPIALMGLFVTFMLVKNRANLIIFYYQAIVILPVMTLGWARWYELAQLSFSGALKLPKGILLLWGIPLFLFVANLSPCLSDQLTPRNQYWVTQDTHEVDSCADWINRRVQKDDFVAANPNIAWLLESRVAPYLQIVTWYGETTQGYENGNKRERFRYDCSLEKARYAVIGDIDQRWTFGEPNVNKVLERLKTNHWPIVWKGNYYLILANPAYLP